MREAIGGTWITQLIIIFMFIFVAYLALSINYSKAFRVKNQTLSIIEKREGINDTSLKYINSYLKKSGYDTKGKCKDMGNNVYGISNLNSTSLTLVRNTNEEYYYCLVKVKSPSKNFQYKAYYKVKLFFHFSLPVMGNISTFDVSGQTKDVIYPADGDCSSSNSRKCQ